MPKKSKQEEARALAASLTLTDIESLVTEIADYKLTIDGLNADKEKVYRRLDASKARLAAKVEPYISQKNTALLAVEKTYSQRCGLVALWAEAHKDTLFAEPRSLKLLRATIGFRQAPPKVTFLAGVTAKMAALLLRRRKWGRAYLRPPEINHQDILRDEADFQTQPERLASVGIVITRTDDFHIEVEQSGSDATGKEGK